MEYRDFYSHVIIPHHPPPLLPTSREIEMSIASNSICALHLYATKEAGSLRVTKKVREKPLFLAQRAFTSSSVRAKNLIHQVRTRSERDIRQRSDKYMETSSDIIIWSLCNWHAESIIDVKLGDAHADSYRCDPMTALLSWWDKIKKDQHCIYCHNQQNHFSTFVLSVDGMLGR